MRMALRQTLASVPDADVRVIPAVDEFADGAGLDLLGFNVLVTTGMIGDPEAEDRMDELLDPEGGIRRLLESDRTLDGLVSDVAVKRCSGYQTFPGKDAGALALLGATWFVRCSV